MQLMNYEMSRGNLEVADTCCASCGAAEVDDVELTECDGCDLVRYCSDECREDHRTEHETKCKERAAELRDELLFKQLESTHVGDCPICCLPLPIDHNKSSFYTCCGKAICDGCAHADDTRQWEENRQQLTSCPFCRHIIPETDEESNKNIAKRAKANDPGALTQMGKIRCDEGDFDAAYEYFTKAAELGDANAHYNLSIMYREGEGVEKDEKKQVYHFEEAAVRGHPDARHFLGRYEVMNGRSDRAVKHFIIAANLGYNNSIKALKECYKHKVISKDCFAAALRAHHAAVKATKSPQRDAAEKCGWGRCDEPL